MYPINNQFAKNKLRYLHNQGHKVILVIQCIHIFFIIEKLDFVAGGHEDYNVDRDRDRLPQRIISF